jgi:hypothetical protein
MLSPYMQWGVLFVWALPGAAIGFLCLLHRDRPLVPVFLLGGYACYGIGLINLALPDWVPNRPTMARLPLPGLLFLQLALGVLVYRAGLLDPRTWPRRVARMTAADPAQTPRALLEAVVAVALVYCLIPQVWTIFDAPYLARAYVAPLLGKENQQLDLKPRFDALLAPVGQKDVVLSDPRTSWPVPSSRGRIVFAVHPEWFASDEPAREEDVQRFFAADASEAERVEVLERREVRWILLNREELETDVFDALRRPSAEASADGDLVLMEAAAWRRAGG